MATENETPRTIPEKVIMRRWPKMIFLWPTVLLCLVMGLLELWFEGWSNTLGLIFVLTFIMNLIVITFEFPRLTSLTLAFGIIAGVVTLILVNQQYPFIPGLGDWIKSLAIYASSEFYFALLIGIAGLYLGMFVVTRFDYWELTPNELVHRHGLLGDLERHSTSGLRFSKEISDVFEWLLAGAGTLILNIPGKDRPVVLENVLGVNGVLEKADILLDAKLVRVAQSEAGVDTAD